ncbi:hypothetical protein F9L33_08790 [Amylibacter sp. SFDW26]|uniref:hypothetical protein n=1 Tax=Amylibacter sp. SFDW26 TaxID=2652722 RepID=UPI0012617CE2|nr:hypothetical protein [Amylibacter sp. SFDW26]KAB7614713.1 hypothetical protein F9L33_08790 [Amylibacter sp. SFDW26]
MALPIIPLAVVAGAVALARNVHISPVDQRVEDRLDDVGEGFSVHRDKAGQQLNSSYRWKRTVRFGKNGQGYEIDASALGRIKFKKVN